MGVEKIVCERGWESTVLYIPRFVTNAVYQFYANLSDNILVAREDQFEKVAVKGCVYEFSLRIISEY